MREDMADEVWDNKALAHHPHDRWVTSDGTTFYPSAITVDKVPPGMYRVRFNMSMGLPFFERLKINTEDLIQFPGTNSETIIREIQDFWERKELFEQYEVAYKRGIFLYGPPGSGKSCIIRLVVADLVKNRGGVCLIMGDPETFMTGLRKFREIQPETPVVVLLEDIDEILRRYNESEVLNILDGLENVDNTVFLATTNYPKRLGARIINRPSRFDKRFLIDFPTIEAREIYLKNLAKRGNVQINIKKWAKDTEKFTFAHLKELFVAVVILDNDYETSLESLKKMRIIPEDPEEFDEVDSSDPDDDCDEDDEDENKEDQEIPEAVVQVAQELLGMIKTSMKNREVKDEE